MERITSKVVQPTPYADSLNTGGTVSNTSRMVAAMNGMIMTARTSEAVRMPVPKGGPANRSSRTGMPSNVSITRGCRYSAISGAMTKKPHMP